MPGRSTTDVIFILKQTIEQYREGQKDICVTFIDLEKAYDRVPREEIWRTMRERLVPEKYVKLVQDMYTGCRTKVHTVAGESSKFNVEVGLHQGSALSPYLFLILMDVLTERVRKEASESMLFADDIVLCGDKDVDMTELRTQNNLFRSVRPGDSTLRLVRVAIMRVTLCIHIYSTNAVYLRNTRGGRHSSIHSNIHCLGSLRIL